ncbi:MAG: hypothetical protein ACYC9K_00850 [Sulfuricaulis sp.]
MGSVVSSAMAPDPSSSMNSQSALADQQAQIAGDQWNFYKQNYQPIEQQLTQDTQTGLPIDQNASATKMVGAVDNSSNAANAGLGFATQQLGDYNSTYAPELKSYFNDLSKGVDPETYVAQAHTDVAGAFDKARQQNRMTMASYGLNPAGGNFQNQEMQTGVQEAQADANAENTARIGAQNLNLERKGAAANVGQSVLSNAVTGINSGVNNMGAVAARYGMLTDANYNRQIQTINAGNRLVNQAQTGLNQATNAYNNLVPQQTNYANNVANGIGGLAGLGYQYFNNPSPGTTAPNNPFNGSGPLVNYGNTVPAGTVNLSVPQY